MKHAHRLVVTMLCLLLAACAVRRPEQPGPARPPVAVSAAENRARAQVAMELDRLRAALDKEVPGHLTCGGRTDTARIALSRAALKAADVAIDRPQLIVVVDRSPRAQKLCVFLATPAGRWRAVGGSKVSTGQAGRRGYFITPTGVFRHSPSILDYRAEGTFNENHIRGLGLKGMRVWDFGWQQAQKGWRSEEDTGEIRLLMHATDPDYLEPRLGRPASKGCVRIPATMNRFLDRHGVLDSSYEQAAADDERFRAVLLPDREPAPLAGELLVVIDSSEATPN